MNSQLLISAINASDDLNVISAMTGMSVDELKAVLIRLIDPSLPSEPVAESDLSDGIVEESDQQDDSSEEIDSDEDESVFDRIIRKSPIPFSEEQIQFMRLAVLERKNLALLSSAGSGKSAIIETVVRLFQSTLRPVPPMELVERYGPYCDIDAMSCASKIGLCASTGKAASLINGRTFHSYFGIGLARGTVEDWVKRVSTSKQLRGTFIALRAVQVIIIDEISMISAQLLDKLSLYLQAIRKSSLPFGEVQMIFVGDFCQLPAVTGTYAFRSRQYKLANVQEYQLTKCFRQSGDPAFLEILKELRVGKCSDKSLRILQSRTTIDEEYSAGMQPMRLVSTNDEVDTINMRELKRLCLETGATPKSYPIIMGDDPRKGEACRKAEGIPESVEIAIGVQIMVIHNISSTIVNGTQGIVMDMGDDMVSIRTIDGSIADIPYISMKDPDHLDIYTAKSLLRYMPVRLGFAGTIHKSQGASLSLVDIDCRRVFCHGQMYVAISRCTDLRGLRLTNFSRKAVICDPIVRGFLGVE